MVPGNNTPPLLGTVRPHHPVHLAGDWDGPGHITVTFSNYGDNIPRDLARVCTARASIDAWRKVRTVWNEPIGKSVLVYDHSDVFLHIMPAPAMDWKMLYYVSLVLDNFEDGFDSMAFDFEAEVPGVEGFAATGNLTMFPPLAPS